MLIITLLECRWNDQRCASRHKWGKEMGQVCNIQFQACNQTRLVTTGYMHNFSSKTEEREICI